ncbi:DUF2651 family protein [Cytobacillus horneckiae]|uniref:DUF2651 family protein n=1 Tax=Cytobacillus horneckiae TaxID=549687 RepID=UPI001562630A|nr:DUF2651 family protein [Bacillus sp. CRN 9]
MTLVLTFLIYPTIVLAVSIIGTVYIRKWVVFPIITAIIFTILTLALYDPSFFIWTAVYIVLSAITAFGTKFFHQRY